ncbi:MAG: glutathione-disulfide reductase [Pseudorhodoplanes sp.]|uniref:glutathione-disulfide reductase n=1 Tax=Pseudorhodoplanes sp. TaxID=1934341 RepID=UPI003D0E3A8F
MSDFDVDLFVIGAGSGGVRAARIAANHGATVIVAEEYRVGGTCVIRGCVPKKLLVYAARFADEFEDAAGYGWTLQRPVFDWPTLIANKDREIARLEAAYVANLERSKVKIVRSRAILEDAHRVRLVATGEVVRARHILIATGGWPSLGADIAGLEHVITSNEALDLAAFPKRILIQGGGYIAVEFAGIFHGLGAEVTLVYRGDNILRGFDDDVREHLRGEMEKRGIRILTRKLVEGVEKVDHGLCVSLSDHEAVVVDQVMFATGRRPNVTGIGLDRAGVQLNERGAVKVDRYSRTSVPHIYAVGDVTDRVNLTPVAIREGHAFADTVFGGREVAVDHADIPTAVFSEPEVGVIGLTEMEARHRYARVDIYKSSFRTLKMTLAARDTRCFFKLVVDGDSDRVLGCHIIGPDAGEMIQLVGIAIKMNATKADFDRVMAVHPTAAEELVTMRTKAATYVREAAE